MTKPGSGGGAVEMSPVYRFVRSVARIAVLRWFRIRVEGLEHLPSSGPCLLLPNHQSALDPLLVQGICPRPVSTMTKSTQFASPVFRWILTSCDAFPTRRYRVDPQAIRVLLRNLDEGRVVCLYPEGERSWDGRLQPLRRGAVRVALRAGVPVIPVGIEGTYDIWPRWRSFPRLGRTVHLRFGTPLDLGSHRSRKEREPQMADAAARIREELLRLSGEMEGDAYPARDAGMSGAGATPRGSALPSTATKPGAPK